MLVFWSTLYADGYCLLRDVSCRETLTNQFVSLKREFPKSSIKLDVKNVAKTQFNQKFSKMVLEYFGYTDYEFHDPYNLTINFKYAGDIIPAEISAVLKYLRMDDENFNYTIPFIDAVKERISRTDFYYKHPSDYMKMDLRKNLLQIFDNLRLVLDYNTTLFLSLYTINKDEINPLIANYQNNGINNALRILFDEEQIKSIPFLISFLEEFKKDFILKFMENGMTKHEDIISSFELIDVLNTIYKSKKGMV